MKKNIIAIIKEKSTLNLPEFKNFINKHGSMIDKEILIKDYSNQVTVNDFELLLEKYKIQNFNDYILITDSLVLAISSYRLFHYDFHDFIYFFNESLNENLSNYPDNQKEFVNLLVNLKGINNETLPKHLYINMNESNYSYICTMDNLRNHILMLDVFEIKKHENFSKISKTYFINENESFFLDNDSQINEDIILYQDEELDGSSFSITSLDHAKIYSFYAFYYLLKKSNEFTNFISKVMSKTSDNDFKIIFFTHLLDLVDLFIHDSKTKIGIISVFLHFECDHDKILRRMESYFYKEDLEKKYYKSIYNYLNSGFFRKKFEFTDYFYDVIYKLHRSYSLFIKESVNLHNNVIVNSITSEEKQSEKIVILIDQFLTKLHAPTAVLIGTLKKMLNKTNNKFLIVIEENFVTTPEETISFLSSTGNPSGVLQQLHKEFFLSDRVEFLYADIQKVIAERSEILLNKIMHYKPSMILSFSSHSSIQNILYEKYPVINISLGAEILVNNAHLYLYKNASRAKELNQQVGLKINDNVLDFVYDSELVESTKNYNRQEFGYSEEDFIIITSGNRINTEIDSDLIDEMKLLLSQYPNIKWLLVGSEVPSYLVSSFDKKILRQVKHIPFEEDLIALNKICDISINPKRVGGGYSVVSCLLAGIPVIMCEFESDGLVFIGRENTFGNSYKNIINVVERTSKDSDFKKQIFENQLKFFEGLAENDNTDILIKYIDDIKNKYSGDQK